MLKIPGERRGESKAALKIVGVLVVAFGLAFAIFAWNRERERSVATSAAPPSDPSAPVASAATSAPVMAPTSIAMDVPAPSSVDAGAGETFDRFAAREAIETALAAKDVSALAGLEQTDLAKDGYVAASAIDAVGKLAAIAPEPAKGEAVRTLARWLEQESKRGTPDATGNVAIVVESLADTRSKDAIGPLVSALDAGTYPLSVQTSIVQSLDVLDGKAAAPSVERFAARVAAMKPADPLEVELAKEATATAQTVLAKWRATP